MDTLSAVKAYQAQMNRMQDVSRSADDEHGAQPSAFAQMVENALSETDNSLRQAEAVQLEAMTGKAELTDLVTAVTSAELSLNTVVAVRDRVINAYNEIIRMAI